MDPPATQSRLMASQSRRSKANIGSTGAHIKLALEAVQQPFVLKSCSDIGSPPLWLTPPSTLWVRGSVEAAP